jgi:hypothetical protein
MVVRMRHLGVLIGWALGLVGLIVHARAMPAAPGDHHAVATVDTAKTSIYIGNVTLTMPPFKRTGEVYQSTYQAKVFPYFFYNERGTIAITLSDDELRRLSNGETVYFNGEAEDTAGDPRRIEGRVVPDDALSGKIKVRVWVSPKIELIFNTTYRFTGGSGAAGE